MSVKEEIREQENEIVDGLTAAEIEAQHPADAAETIEGLDIADQVKFIKQLPTKDAADSIAEMENHDQKVLIQSLNRGLAARIVEQMSPDDATDLLEELDYELQQALLRRVPAEDRAELKTLLTFDPDTAGGVMNIEVVILDQDLTADQAIAKLREEVEDKEIPYYAYLTDAKDRLVGVVSLRDLLLAKRGVVLKELVKTQNLITVSYSVDREEVAHLIAHYNLLALPVVDFGNRLLGVVTVDDVIDIIHEEASEDMQTMVGAGADETTDSPWLYSVRMRLPWLVINVLFSTFSAWVVHLFEGNIAQMAFLAVLMPLVANQAGNTGQQALAVMIRQLAMERFDRKRAWIAVLRELRIGLLNGMIIATLVVSAIYFTTGKPVLASVMGLALGLDMILGALAGASIPLVLKEMGRDPAQASSIFLTTITDSMGFLLLLGLAGLVLL
ncbi:magnesium transporter [Pseudodesulfovibrio sp. zrk46]|uniref:magnesium transporter n=1 Tax=Pseudodesulfovibrio sp. zrk46 TaxID=2725288 RepID=UPI001449AF7E|nr:magnesium transporter [Pseudodesulfovibrio sp. zrk46]QJB57794.1 magnesium transporter [Pseudodesulfovibrio sp. zrk46]